MSELAPGSDAPDFETTDQHGERIRLREITERQPVVLYFYPKDGTPGCTVEACAFRDSHTEFVAAGAKVIGVSSDSQESHVAFAERHRLPFSLISDPDGAIRKAYGVRPSMLGALPGRVTFVIGRGGVVRNVYRSAVRVKEHVRRALNSLR